MAQSRMILQVIDGEIIRVLKHLLKAYPSAVGNVSVGDVTFELKSLDDERVKAIVKNNGYTIAYFNMIFGSYQITYETRHGLPTTLAKFEQSKIQGHTELPNQFQFFLDASKELVVLPLPELTGESNLALAGFKKIETALAGAVSTFSDLQASYLNKTEELQKSHDEELSKLKDRIDEDRKALEAEIAEKRAEIVAIQKTLDDRSNTHARRDIRKEIKASIADSLGKKSFSLQSDQKRTYVRYVYVAAICALGVLALLSAFTLNEAVTRGSVQGIWFGGIKASVASLSLIAFILLYLRWETSWLNQHSNFETQLSATSVDIDRASWIAESLLEWNRESPDREIPTVLIESFSRRLFDWDVKSEDHHSASDSLASAILGSAAKLQIGPQGANIELDRKGIQKINKG